MRINKIKDNDIANGFGINMSLWTQGCPHCCKGCFNGETWSFTGGREFTGDDLNYILTKIDNHNVKRDLSILGGEPLCTENAEGILQVCKAFKSKYPNKKIYIWTGYVFENFDEVQKKILNYIDVLVDGKFEEENKNLSLILRGSSNQRVIDVKETLQRDKIVLLDINK
ncbi:MAG: anaerobic ribonucleoside-triphosphate reductase activating protein [Terrisporobacter sp.]|uniref:anaerobic ribonucleoside-triphosphate reductase activating protein n=1 Tax=Terrisporobacter sp. TaxID=1965305 RepID=UPI002FC7DB3E